MNKRVKWVGLVVGAFALAAVFLGPVARNYARAGEAANAAGLTLPVYADNVTATSTPGITTPNGGNNTPQNYWNYMYGMMNEMMGPYWNSQINGGQSPQGNYPYYGMMGGYWGNPGQPGPYTPPQAPGSNGGVSGSVYGTVYGTQSD